MAENAEPHEIEPHEKIQMMRQQLENAYFILRVILGEVRAINEGPAADLLAIVCKTGKTDPLFDVFLAHTEFITASITETGSDVCKLHDKLRNYTDALQITGQA